MLLIIARLCRARHMAVTIFILGNKRVLKMLTSFLGQYYAYIMLLHYESCRHSDLTFLIMLIWPRMMFYFT